ncbi:MAG: response regulator [Polyangiaceae bacterium]|jgi:CheY-like chemotaxis protein
MSAPDPPHLQGIRVLVVDDDADNREMLTLMLEHGGAIVSTADSADEALKGLETERPQVLISDIGLPGEDGFSLLRRVRATPGGGNIPAIALTGYGATEFRARGGAELFHAHLTKPIVAEEMLAAITRLVRAGVAGDENGEA